MEKLKIFHFNIPVPSGNFGDDVIYYATRKSLREAFSDFELEWVEFPVRNHTTKGVIDKANECDFILVGPGGLLLKSRVPNKYSEWQWACSIDHLSLINKPLIIYSIGYNKFRNQEDFGDKFNEHVNAVIDISSYFSVRNVGSKRALIDHGIKEVDVSPCPTLFYNDYVPSREKKGIIGINLAGDRGNLRFNKLKFYNNIKFLSNELKINGYKQIFLEYNWNPESNCHDLIEDIKGNSFICDTCWNKKDVDEKLKQHRLCDVIVAMRSHAQIVPFGMGLKVASLVSHDKLNWFLEDMNMLDTAIDVNTDNFGEYLFNLITDLYKKDSYEKRQEESLRNSLISHKKAQNKIRESVLYG